jgi:hypothetical protein
MCEEDMTTRWRGSDAMQEIRKKAAQRLLAMAAQFVTAHMDFLNVSNPRPHVTPSQPGEYPRKRTGFGQRSVSFQPTSVAGVISAGLKIRVGYLANAEYMLILELRRRRLGLLETLRRTKSRLQVIAQQ